MLSVLIPFSSVQFVGNETEQNVLLLVPLILQQTGSPLAFSQSVLKYKQNSEQNLSCTVKSIVKAIDLFTLFSTFDMDKLGKIRRHHWKEHLNIS